MGAAALHLGLVGITHPVALRGLGEQLHHRVGQLGGQRHASRRAHEGTMPRLFVAFFT